MAKIKILGNLHTFAAAKQVFAAATKPECCAGNRKILVRCSERVANIREHVVVRYAKERSLREHY
ncbi:hypothetical protein A2U01_0007614, partial [Trifolium medium]|nr:hypothetical protein [Trifolium medium]